MERNTEIKIVNKQKELANNEYKASLTREQFLFNEMRVTARLLAEGYNEREVRKMIAVDNLFQYPTEKSINRMTKLCVERLNDLDDATLINAIATETADIAKQICLYAMMKHSRLVKEFMISVIGEKYKQKDNSFARADVNVFFLRLQEQNDTVATWSSSTIEKIKQVLIKVLVETGYLDNTKADKLNLILINRTLENVIIDKNDKAYLSAFNCFN